MAVAEEPASEWWDVKLRCSHCNRVDRAGNFATHPVKKANTGGGLHTCTLNVGRCMWDPVINAGMSRVDNDDRCFNQAENIEPFKAAYQNEDAVDWLPYCKEHTCNRAGCLNPKFKHCEVCGEHGELPYTASLINGAPTTTIKVLLTRLEIKPVSEYVAKLKAIHLTTAEDVLVATEEYLATAEVPRMYLDAILNCDERAPAKQAKITRNATYCRDSLLALEEVMKHPAVGEGHTNAEDCKKGQLPLELSALLTRLDIQPVEKLTKAIQKAMKLTESDCIESVVVATDADLKKAGLSKPFREGFLADAEVVASREIVMQGQKLFADQFGSGFRHGLPTSPTYLPPGPIPMVLKKDWVPDKNATTCMEPSCSTRFSKQTRRHHCRICGSVVCGHCSGQLGVIPAKTRRCWHCQGLIDSPRLTKEEIKVRAEYDAASKAIGPLTARTLAGDLYELHGWGAVLCLKTALSNLHPALGMPDTFELIHTVHNEDAFDPLLFFFGLGQVKANFDFDAVRHDMLTFKAGDIITMTKKEDGGWSEGVISGKVGIFPSNLVVPYSSQLLPNISDHRRMMIEQTISPEFNIVFHGPSAGDDHEDVGDSSFDDDDESDDDSDDESVDDDDDDGGGGGGGGRKGAQPDIDPHRYRAMTIAPPPGPPPGAAPLPSAPFAECPVPSAPLACPKAAATAFFRSLNLPETYLNSSHDRCYCKECYSGWETIDNEGPTPYVVPEPGWVRFGLHVERRARAMDIFNKWSACFHGVKSTVVLKSILDCGGLMKPGDRLVDGTLLKSTKCADRQDKVVYTSPTIKYAGLKFYAEPNTWFDTTTGTHMCASIVLQCRQNPGTFRAQGETMGFGSRMPGHLEQHCPNVNLAEIEWKTKADRAVIPYGMLVRVWPAGADPEADAYKSPVDTSHA